MAQTPEEIQEVIKDSLPKEEEKKQEQSSEEKQQEVSFSEIELQALDQGWKPKEEFEGDPDEWVSAKEYIRRGEYYKKIHNQNRKIKQLEDSLTKVANHHKKVFDAAYKKAKRDLDIQYRQAIREEDDAAADVIEAQREELEAEYKKQIKDIEIQQEQEEGNHQQQKGQQPQLNPEFASWVKRNDWFVKDQAMRARAEHIGVAYAQANPDLTNAEVYDYVTKEIKKIWPEKFRDGGDDNKRKRGSPVEGGDTVSRNSNSNKSVVLSEEEETVFRTLQRQGMYKTKDEYITELKKAGLR